MTPDALARLHAASIATPRPWSAREFAGLLAMPGACLSAGAADFALGRLTLDEAELLTIAVHPDHRRAGLGAARLAAWEGQMRARGAACVYLEVAIDNLPALALYHAAGYVRVGQRRGYYRHPCGQPVDALVMRRDLPAT